jgi:hypothetical protein
MGGIGIGREILMSFGVLNHDAFGLGNFPLQVVLGHDGRPLSPLF